MPSSDVQKIEEWNAMMSSCRTAVKAANSLISKGTLKKPYIEFKEPEFLNWYAGKGYHTRLWSIVNVAKRRKQRSITGNSK